MDALSTRLDDIVNAIDEAKDMLVGIGMMTSDLSDLRKMGALSTAAYAVEKSLGARGKELQKIRVEVADRERTERSDNPVSPDFATAYATYCLEVAAYNANSEDGDVDPIEQRFLDAVIVPARVKSNAEAAMLIKHVIASDSIGDTFDAKLVDAVLAHLEGRAE